MDKRSRDIQISLGSVEKLWNKWQLRMMILLSLSLQIILVVFGNRRKHSARTWVRILVWATYLSADWAATVSLGMLARSQVDSKDDSLDPHNVIAVFWTPFLLLHLGGPDTITAYSLEDNELWLRHLLGLIVQVGLAFYVFFRSWTSGTLLMFHFLAIPVFVAGIIKYGERTRALRSACSSLLPPPDPGPDYAEFVDDYLKKHPDAYTKKKPSASKTELKSSFQPQPKDFLVKIDRLARINHAAFSLFTIFRRLYAGLILSAHKEKYSYDTLMTQDAKDAFDTVSIALGFMYDVLYTKATLIYSRSGIILRSISFLCSISALVSFWVIVDKHVFSNIDITITYLLLLGAILIEIYAGLVLIFSDWALLWVSGLDDRWRVLLSRFLLCARSHLTKVIRSRWLASMSQYNLIGFCLKDKPIKFDSMYEMLQKYQNNTWEDVTIELKKLILQQLREKHKRLVISYDAKRECSERGDSVLRRKNCSDKFGWSIVDKEFDHSLLLWHIATDLCYYSEANVTSKESKHKVSKSLSEYMLYLLVMYPSMLPKPIDEMRFRDTCAQVRRFFKQERNLKSSTDDRNLLLEVHPSIPPELLEEDKSKSVLFDGCRLAKLLQSLETEEKWEMISQVWVEMLFYAATRCEWKYHGEALSRGGELVTHVRLFMEHSGLSEQFQIREGISIPDA